MTTLHPNLMMSGDKFAELFFQCPHWDLYNLDYHGKYPLSFYLRILPLILLVLLFA